MSHDLEHQKTAMNENVMELVRHAIADDPYIFLQEITEICNLSRGTFHWVIHEEIGMKKVCSLGTLLPNRGTKKNGESEMC